MQARPRRDDPTLVAALVGQWERLVARVDALPDERFAEPSRLPGWTVAELVAHTARSVAVTIAALVGPTPTLASETPTPERAVVGVPDYLMGTGAWAEAIAGVARSDAVRQDPAAVRTLLWGAVEAASAGLADAHLDRVVVTPGGSMRLGGFLVTRAVEAVVHGLDLGVAPARDALRVVVRAFVDTLAAKAPGRTVELRVPPFAAAQLVAGPRHTRGTPPNVVEADPVAFVEVAAGRLRWADAVADGRVRASGDRSDLSGYLPLL